jgi:hypothetical protein
MASSESRTPCSGGRRCCLARSYLAGTVGMTHCLNVWHIISWCVPSGGGAQKRVGKGVLMYDLSIIGRWLYRVRCHTGHPAPRGGGLGSQKWAQPRLVGFVGHLSLGACVLRLASMMRADRVFLGQGIGAFLLFILPCFCPDLLRFRSLLFPTF